MRDLTFSEYIQLDEGRKKIGMDTKAKGGTTTGDYLKDIYDAVGSKPYSSKDIKKVNSDFHVDHFMHRQRLMKDGFLYKDGPKFRISKAGLKWISDNGGTLSAADASEIGDTSADTTDDETPDNKLAKGVRDVSKTKEKKFIVPKVSKNSKYVGQLRKILSHMETFGEGHTKVTYMLAGDPGTGKTSFVRSLSKLTGLPLVIIEAPHITQEHLINIPFLVLDGHKERTGNLVIDNRESKMKVVQSESNLVTQLRHQVKKTPDQIMREINKQKVLKDVYPLVKYGIDQIEGMYNSILFLDEYYRTSSVKIRNVLRNILNGKIGNDKVPKGVYIIMASNLNDEGIDEISLNNQFQVMNYDINSKEDFMSYMYGKYVDNGTPEAEAEANDQLPDGQGTLAPSEDQTTPNETVSFDVDVWNTFMEQLTDEDLGFNDEEADVRLSPRRLEQMLIYINAVLPVSTVQEAQNLLAFVKTNLSNYIDDATSQLYSKFYNITCGLIEKTSPDVDIELVKSSPIKKSDWRSQLQQEVEVKIKLGDDRSYIPVVSGHPGIGKTSQMIDMAEELGMGFIHIDVANLTTENVTGLPIADVGGNDNITTKFSEPDLYLTIKREYDEMINDVYQKGRKYNVILMFDELNRAPVPVFNSIRKVLLEKSFGGSYDLPDDIMLTGAINPTDEGTEELTSHTRDVLDIIPSAGNFTELMNYLENDEYASKVSKKLGFNLGGILRDIMSQLATEFQSDEDNDDNKIDDIDVRPFWWNDGENIFYVSPREMTAAITNTIGQIKSSLGYMQYDPDQEYSEEAYDKFITEMLNVTASTFVDTFNMIEIKQEAERFSEKLGKKILGNSKFKQMFELIKRKEDTNRVSLSQTLANVNGDVDYLQKDIVGPYITRSKFTPTEFGQDISNIINRYISGSTPDKAIEKTINFYDVLYKTLGEIPSTNAYKDKLKKKVGGTIVSILKETDIDLFDIIQNDKLMNTMANMLGN